MTEATLPDDVAREIASPASYAEWDSLHRTLARVRRELPFARAELAEYAPFWVASKLSDIREVASRNTEFLSGLGGLATREQLAFEAEKGTSRLFRSIVAMNEPDHRSYRALTQSWFQLGNLRRFEPRIRALAKRHVDRLGEIGGECDFVREVAVHYPLFVVMAILGVPEDDEPFVLRLTREFFGSADRELNRGGVARTPLEAAASTREVVEEATAYFRHLSDARRRAPTGDLISVIANGRVDGEPIREIDAMGYYITVAFAGHDTTSSSVAGGVWALAERPPQLARVRANPALVPALVEESVRWTTPIHQFVRTAARDVQVAGQRVRKGDLVVLCFPSGNRDEDAFEAPCEFRADRTPNRHIGFGFGAHMCLGVHLARLEMACFFEELLPRLESLELAGIPRRTVTNFVGGPKSLPIRFQMREGTT
ncbi:MAG TPA: cytochrome P450 [Myxococcota bacterium]|nr:cytochrome P450 [Myxococcota bacterium]